MPATTLPEPLVTVVIPVWDAYVGERLDRALASVAAAGAEADVVVVDNASTVPVGDLDGRARLVRAERRASRGAARNLGLEAVRTPFVVFLDADDELLPGALDRMLARTRLDREACAWVMGIVDGATGRPYRIPRAITRLLMPIQPLFAVANSVWSLMPTQGASLLRTEAVRAVGGYGDSDYAEDWELGAVLAFSGRVSVSLEPALVYHWHEASPEAPGADPAAIARGAARVRGRLRTADVPGWVKLVLPLVALGQRAALYGARPVVRRARSAMRRRERA